MPSGEAVARYMGLEPLTPGEIKIVARPGAVLIDVNFPENLMIEINGKRFPMGLRPGEHQGELPAPQP